MDKIDSNTKASCLDWSNGKFNISCRLQSSPSSHSDFKEECSALCIDNGHAALAAGNHDSAIKLYSAVINLNSASHTVFANRSEAKLGKKLWTEALLDAQKVR
jgi:hypothetical protein